MPVTASIRRTPAATGANDDLERTGLRGVVQMGTAAEALDGVAGLYHADGLAVLLAEQCHSALLLGIVEDHFLGDNRAASQSHR